MLKKTLAIRSHFKIVISKLDGDLRLTGWDREEISAKTDGETLDLVLDGERVTVSCDSDLILNVPRAASVQVDSVGGDVEARILTGALSLGSVSGDLSLRETAALNVEALEGDLAVRACAGAINAARVEGDVSLREVNGDVNLDSVAGDLFARGVTGAFRARVEEDAVLHLEPQAGSAVDVSAESDILLHLPANANAVLTLTADDPDNIEVQMPAAASSGANPRSVILGDGSGAAINLKAEGDILVTSESKEWESAAEFDFGGGWPLPDDFSERINRRVQDATRRAAQKSEAAARRMEAGMRRAEEGMRRAEEKMRDRRFSFNWSPGRGMPPAPPSEPVSDEERMTILRMLQEKKISAEEAEKLLSALEGEQ